MGDGLLLLYQHYLVRYKEIAGEWRLMPIKMLLINLDPSQKRRGKIMSHQWILGSYEPYFQKYTHTHWNMVTGPIEVN